MHKWLCVAILLSTIFSGIVLSSCGDNPPGGYLSQTATSVLFIQFTATGQNQQQINGNIDEVEENTSDNPPDIKTSTTAFTGVENGSALTFTIAFFGISSSYTGSLNGNTLILDLPQSDGSIRAQQFVASSLQQYNQTVAALQQQVANQVEQYNNAQATATAAESTAVAQQQEQQAVQDINQRLTHDLSPLQQESETLAQFSEGNTLQRYAKVWQQMQNDYTTEQQGCGSSNVNQTLVPDAAALVDEDYAQINEADAQFDEDQLQYHQELSAVQADMQNVQNDWMQLQQAVANNPSGIPGAAFIASDIQSAIDQGKKAVNTAQGVWGNAQSSVKQYDQEASALLKKADALLGSMNCN